MLDDKRFRGLFKKFKVSRVDGTDSKGGKHYNCDYFVLDITHDPYVVEALRAYANACENDLPFLAKDLREKIELHSRTAPLESKIKRYMNRVLRFVVEWLNLSKRIANMQIDLTNILREVAETKSVVEGTKIVVDANSALNERIIAKLRELADAVANGANAQEIQNQLNAAADELDGTQAELAAARDKIANAVASGTAAADEIDNPPAPPVDDEDEEETPPTTETPVETPAENSGDSVTPPVSE